MRLGEPQRRRCIVLRARIQHSLRLHQAASDCGRVHGRPKGPGHLVRREYVAGRGVLSHRCGRAGRNWQRMGSRCRTPPRSVACAPGGIKTTFTEETETDLFGEQAVLCVAVPRSSLRTASRRWWRLGTSRRLRTLSASTSSSSTSCTKVALPQRWSVSDTAEYGDYVSGPRVIDEHVKENMKAVLDDIQSGVLPSASSMTRMRERLSSPRPCLG